MAEPGTVIARWPIGRLDPEARQPHAELRLTYETRTGESNCYTAILAALHTNTDGTTNYIIGTPTILVYQRPGTRLRRGQLERSYQRALTVLRERFIHDRRVRDYFDPASGVFTELEAPSTLHQTIRVAVRTTATDVDDSTWVICTCPVSVLGDSGLEAQHIRRHCPTGYSGDVVVLDAVEGFEAGCCTWSRFSDRPDPQFTHGSERAQARAQHQGCEHPLFGTSTQGWTDYSDEYMGEAIGTLTTWVLQTLDWCAVVVHTTDERDVAAVWVYRGGDRDTSPDDEDYDGEVLVSGAPYPNIAEAKCAATALIVDLLTGRYPGAAD
ncbi:hypothetical protein [Nocardia sp. NPDC050710]|uniref:hypothetical protein n=1 Tax=Nocardia sp. NPDC050710 TaxID=3157220 RepID=UPI0033DFF35A